MFHVKRLNYGDFSNVGERDRSKSQRAVGASTTPTARPWPERPVSETNKNETHGVTTQATTLWRKP